MRDSLPSFRSLLVAQLLAKTEERALQEVKIAMQLWLETAKEIGRSIPVPLKRSLIAGLA